jgi:glutamate-ammonia-ligase adenylyltransferase
LAAIAQRLLTAIAATTDPDATLRNLVRVSDSLGGKAVLWELFQYNPPSLELYVEICASSPFLCEVLTTQPGMIDELLDSLLVNRLPNLLELQHQLADLMRGAKEPLPILHSFRNGEKLRVGVRDLLNKEPVERINLSLSNIAEAIVGQLSADFYRQLIVKFGEPQLSAGTENQLAELIIIALGKFGGAELNYHSDLDLIFLYSGDGGTFHRRRTSNSAETTSNLHFFSELAQRLVKLTAQVGPHGRLYEIDSRLRPTGKSGRLATSLDEFLRYFESGEGQLWERQALCRARVLTPNLELQERTRRIIHRAQFAIPWRAEFAREIMEMRLRMQEGASQANLKRGSGGVVDIEFLVQLLQLKHGTDLPEIMLPNTLDALAALRTAMIIDQETWSYLATSYQVLRSIQGRLRLMNMSALNDLPSQPEQQSKLAALLGYPDYEKLLHDCRELQRENRWQLERAVQQAN